VPPFSGEAAGPLEKVAIHHHAAADAGTEDDAEDDPIAAPGADNGFGKREAIGVVGHQHGPAERGREIGGQLAPVDARDVGAFDPARLGIDHAGDGDGERRCRLASGRCEVGKHPAEGGEVAGRCIVLADGSQIFGRARQRRLDRRSANVETNGHFVPSRHQNEAFYAGVRPSDNRGDLGPRNEG
jgi:hypothetical protein